MTTQIGIAGNVPLYGFPTGGGVSCGQISWGGGTYTLPIVADSIKKEPLADVAEAKDIQGEPFARRPRNERWQSRFTIVVNAGSIAAAKVLIANLPKKDAVAVVSGTGDAQVDTAPASNTTLVDSCSGSYTAEGYATIDFTVILYIGKLFVVQT